MMDQPFPPDIPPDPPIGELDLDFSILKSPEYPSLLITLGAYKGKVKMITITTDEGSLAVDNDALYEWLRKIFPGTIQ